MHTETTVLITGAKAGIGKGLLTAYASRPGTTAIAAIRDGPKSESAKTLQSLPTAKGSKIIVAAYDASSPSAAKDLAKFLKTEHGVTSLDVVVANAGILRHYGLTKDVQPNDILEHLKINTLAPILLYQGCQSLLNKAHQDPKFFVISSNIGSNTLMDDYPMPMIAYGMSKAAVNFAAGRIHREEDEVVVVPVQPGWVQTTVGNQAATYAGMDPKDVPVTIDASVAGLIILFDSSTKVEHSGRMWDQNSQLVPW